MKKSGLGVIDGGKKPDVVTVKIIQRAANQMGFLAFVGACDLDTWDRTLEAFEEQGYLDLVDSDATKMRVYREGTLTIIHIGPKAQAPMGLIVPN